MPEHPAHAEDVVNVRNEAASPAVEQRGTALATRALANAVVLAIGTLLERCCPFIVTGVRRKMSSAVRVTDGHHLSPDGFRSGYLIQSCTG